jgi:hypothetical protein
MQEPNFISQEAGLNFNSVVEATIKRSCIIDYGIVQDIVADGVVNVSVAVSRTKQDMFCMTCVLANVASSAFTLNVKPKKGDRVLVVYPRIYNDEMFGVTEDESKNTEIKVDFEAKGYNLMSGIAILINQYKKAGHKNVVTIDEGNISAKLNKVEITTTADGDITVANGKATVSIDKNGNVSVDAQGKYTIKNGTTDLSTVVSKLADEIENLVLVCPNGAGSVDPTSKGKIELWKQQQLQQLFASATPVTP